jgi:hypothetical protein
MKGEPQSVHVLFVGKQLETLQPSGCRASSACPCLNMFANAFCPFREFDNNLILRVFRQPSNNRVRLVLFELDSMTGQYTKFATYASGLTLDRSGNAVTLSSNRTGQRWVQLVFNKGYAELATFFLYVQVLRLLDQQHTGAQAPIPLETISGEVMLFQR